MNSLPWLSPVVVFCLSAYAEYRLVAGRIDVWAHMGHDEMDGGAPTGRIVAGPS